MKKLAAALLTLTAIGVAVKVMKEKEVKRVYSHSDKNGNATVITNGKEATVLIQNVQGIKAYKLISD